MSSLIRDVYDCKIKLFLKNTVIYIVNSDGTTKSAHFHQKLTEKLMSSERM